MNAPELPAHNPRPYYLSFLITQGLGYHCVACFFILFPRAASEQIAVRLGCATRTVNHHRQAWREGRLQCPAKESKHD